MRIAITGAGGLIGTALGERLERGGHEVVRLRRAERSMEARASEPGPAWDPATGWVSPGALEGCDALVHLAGASIGEGRWTAKRKHVLRESRIEATRGLVKHLGTLKDGPRVLVSASAIGVYGDRGDELLDEDSRRGEGFLADLAADWEHEAMAAEAHGLRVAVARFGVVLDRQAGALPRMLLPFRLGAGGRLGNGRQWISWVTLDDATGALEFLLTHDLRGAHNVTAPGSLTNREFTKVLARVLHRPALLPAPGFALRLALGQAADELLLASTRVAPRRLAEAGFVFEQPELEGALRAVLSRPAQKSREHALS
ncbi:MAG: TIGR01777 family oxidoreductase [Dehalococcoidia bacterium]